MGETVGATKSAKKEKSYHHGDLRAALVREGRAMLEESGVGALSLRAAARRVGVSQAAPGYHFGDKSGLLAAIAAQGFDDLKAARLTALQTVDDPAEAVRVILDVYVTFALENQGVFKLMFGEEITRSQYEDLLTASTASFKVFADTIDTYCVSLKLTPAQSDLVTMTAWSLEHGMAQLFLSRQIPLSLKPVDEAELRRFSSDLLLSGLGGLVGCPS